MIWVCVHVSDGFPQKRSLDARPGVSSIQVYFGFFEFFKLCKAPYVIHKFVIATSEQGFVELSRWRLSSPLALI